MNEIVQDIHAKYAAAYGSNLQGCCPLIADEIQRAIGGQVVDPMGDDFLRSEVATGRSEAHRDRDVFEMILPQYERWRI